MSETAPSIDILLTPPENIPPEYANSAAGIWISLQSQITTLHRSRVGGDLPNPQDNELFEELTSARAAINRACGVESAGLDSMLSLREIDAEAKQGAEDDLGTIIPKLAKVNLQELSSRLNQEIESLEKKSETPTFRSNISGDRIALRLIENIQETQ